MGVEDKIDPPEKKPIQLKEVVIKSGSHRGMVAVTMTPLFWGKASTVYRLPQAARLAGQAELGFLFRTFTPLGRVISVIDNLLNATDGIRMSKKTVDDLKADAKYRDKTGGKGGDGTEIYDKDGGLDQANKDFDDIIVPGTAKPLTGRLQGRIGKTSDGKTVNVRNGSSSDEPTLEIYNPSTQHKETKFRY